MTITTQCCFRLHHAFCSLFAPTLAPVTGCALTSRDPSPALWLGVWEGLLETKRLQGTNNGRPGALRSLTAKRYRLRRAAVCLRPGTRRLRSCAMYLLLTSTYMGGGQVGT